MVSTTKINWAAADSEYKRGQQLIKEGDWADGFKLHELRALPDLFWGGSAKFGGVRTSFDKTPIWMPGNSIRGRNVIVWSEAGWGDLIQFSRFIPLLKEAGAARVTLVYPDPIITFVKRLKGIDLVCSPKDCLHNSYRIKTMSLPYLLMEHNQIKPYPVERIYGSEGLYANPDIVKPIRSKPLIGLCWNTTNVSWNMKAKQIPDHYIKKFVEQYKEQADFVSLQLEPSFLDNYLDNKAWHKTADKVQVLDAVISVDSAVAHCAASVGVPTYNLIGDDSVACWRWYPKSEKTYWYDSMTCIWWDDYQDWDTGLNKVAEIFPFGKETVETVPKPTEITRSGKKRGRPKKSVV